MATRLESQPYDTATANFKLWAGFVRNLVLTTSGWTQTSDTGQTNPTTVGTAPTTKLKVKASMTSCQWRTMARSGRIW